VPAHGECRSAGWAPRLPEAPRLRARPRTGFRSSRLAGCIRCIRQSRSWRRVAQLARAAAKSLGWWSVWPALHLRSRLPGTAAEIQHDELLSTRCTQLCASASSSRAVRKARQVLRFGGCGSGEAVSLPRPMMTPAAPGLRRRGGPFDGDRFAGRCVMLGKTPQRFGARLERSRRGRRHRRALSAVRFFRLSGVPRRPRLRDVR